MELHRLDAKTIHSAFLTACDFVIANREQLNAINVFPVADGDTGDNMSATALSVLSHSALQPTLQETLNSLANAALIGARGNSGMIFSQFFNGLTETELTAEYIDTLTFSRMLSQASHSVRSAILHPVEGTIITVIDAWSTSITNAAVDITCFNKLMEHVLPEVHQSLQKTAQMLTVLQEAHVVDAGALGFYHFITGFSDYLANPRALTAHHHHEECLKSHHELLDASDAPVQRYCTEITLAGESLDRSVIAHQLEQFGDSVVSSGNPKLCRFHVHCTQPALVFESLLNTGTITHAKAQDMLRQFQMLHQRKYPIALVTDSSADLAQSILDEYQIHIIQLNMHLDGHHLLDRICVNPDSFYDRLSTLKQYPKTSFPSPALLAEQISHLADHYEQVLILPISQGLSGTHDAIVKASEGLNNVHVVNSCQTSGGLGLLVRFAAQLIASGMPVNAIKQELIAKIAQIEIMVYVNNFDSLIRSGRIGRISGKIAQLTQIKPIIRLDCSGKPTLFDKAFSETKALTKLIRHVESMCQHQALDSYGLVHAGVPEKALSFAQLTAEAFGQPPAFIESASTALGLHAGKGSVALAAMMK
ncbi:DegV family protein [Legionella worsleiensis]|uniref:Lipoprotein n=1 Tax=Legionella worsleiensis TaxID=45076 RepID=A0A0W1AF23_9GAMM|nr:DegV family protein [Legionella worsleiensis]KTD79760.1 lipoprotein [Legionella worsleiensis]STY32271.1 DAK2 domain protein [Legionella worsleiensis]